MNPYEKKYTIDIHDVDFNGVARTSALMRYLQSTAQSQLTDNNLSYDKMRSMNRALIISKIKMEFTEPVRTYEPVTAVTFPCDSRGYTLLRCYKLVRDGVTIGRAVSAWALVNTEDRSLVKINDFDFNLKTYDPLDLPLNRIVIPKETETVGYYTVNYDEIDQNRHMNNTKYPDIYANFLPLSGKRIQSITIGYTSEATFGEVLTVERAFVDGIYYFRTRHSDGRENSVAEIKLCNI